jgi:hypothetical protein
VQGKEAELMTKIIIGEDCGNSPKNIFVRETTIAPAKADSRFILSNVTDDIRWNIIGDRLIEGKRHERDYYVCHWHRIITALSNVSKERK